MKDGGGGGDSRSGVESHLLMGLSLRNTLQGEPTTIIMSPLFLTETFFEMCMMLSTNYLGHEFAFLFT